VSSSADPRMPTNTTLIKNRLVKIICAHTLPVMIYPHPKKASTINAHPLGPLDFFAPSLRVNFFLGGARPSPPGVADVGEGAALDAALLLIL